VSLFDLVSLVAAVILTSMSNLVDNVSTACISGLDASEDTDYSHCNLVHRERQSNEETLTCESLDLQEEMEVCGLTGTSSTDTSTMHLKCRKNAKKCAEKGDANDGVYKKTDVTCTYTSLPAELSVDPLGTLVQQLKIVKHEIRLQLYRFDDVPQFLRDNDFIHSG
jgi:hypothetical protein